MRVARVLPHLFTALLSLGGAASCAPRDGGRSGAGTEGTSAFRSFPNGIALPTASPVALIRAEGLGPTTFGRGWALDVPSIAIDLTAGVPALGPTPDLSLNPHHLHGAKLVGVVGTADEYALAGASDGPRVFYRATGVELADVEPVGGQRPAIGRGFEVTYPDGRHELYSGDAGVAEGVQRSPELAVTTRFPLVYAVAADGTTTAYRYTQRGGRSHLTEILSGGGSIRTTIELFDVPSGGSAYTAGFRQDDTTLVGRIVSTRDGVVTEGWCLAYSGHGEDRAPRWLTAPGCPPSSAALPAAALAQAGATLSRIEIEAAPSPTCATGTRRTLVIAHAPSEDPRSLAHALTASARLYYGDQPRVGVIDVNGDGADDLVAAVSFGAPTAFLGGAEPPGLFSEMRPLPLEREGRELAIDLSRGEFQRVQLDRDGVADLIELASGQIHAYFGARDQDGWRFHVSLIEPTIDAERWRSGRVRFVDLNGDGADDLLELDPSGALSARLNVLPFTDPETLGFYAPNHPPHATPGLSEDLRVLNLADPRVRLRDFDGDRLTDLLVLRLSRGYACLYRNTGRYMAEPDPELALFGEADASDPDCGGGVRIDLPFDVTQSPASVLLIDTNGDGLVDLLSQGRMYTTLTVAQNLGGNRFAPQTLTMNRRGEIDDSTRLIGDFDGDGHDELLLLKTSGDDWATLIDFNRTAAGPLPALSPTIEVGAPSCPAEPR